MRSILFVINTMGIGGGEKALLEIFKRIDFKKYEVSLFVLTGQGELINQVPEQVKLLNKKYYPISVLNRAGKVRLFYTVIRAMIANNGLPGKMRYIISCLRMMMKQGDIRKDKLLWKILSDGAQRFEKEYDLAVAFLEGGAAYYVASHANAEKKAAFIHINYEMAGYNRMLDEDCYLKFDQVFTVSESVKNTFLRVYPECEKRTAVFYNLIDRERIICKAAEAGGFSDNFTGCRILTVGRLVPQKALDMAIDTMRILKDMDSNFRWYVLGEGELRKRLEEKICMFGLEEDFILLGTTDNPFPYYAQCDLYVHTAYFEGKSVAVEEAQVLGCTILVTEYDGVEEQVKDGVDGIICKSDSRLLAEKILDLVNDPQKRMDYGIAASKREQADYGKEIDKLLRLLGD